MSLSSSDRTKRELIKYIFAALQRFVSRLFITADSAYLMKRTLVGWTGISLAVFSLADHVRAECSDSIQCIGISAVSAAEAERNHHGGVPGPAGTTEGSALVTMDFSNRPVASSTVKILYVAAAMHMPPGAVVKLNPIRIDGPDANQFSLQGGTCALNGGDGPTHGANDTGSCTIEVRFRPTSPGVKTARITVPFPQPIAGFIDHRDATLSGIGGDERISPALDSQVAPLIASQVMALRKFGEAQVSNVSNRLASLHRVRNMGAGSTGSAFVTPGRQEPGNPATGALSTEGLRSAIPSIPRHESGRPAGSTADAWPGLLSSLLATRQVPLMLATDGGTEPGTSAGGYWISGVATFGRNGSSASETRFETTGVTAGADLRFGRAVVGAAAGTGRSAHSIGTEGSQTRNTGQSLSIYGSYEVMRDSYVDALLGYGILKSKASRYVAVDNAFASSQRDGAQVFGSVALSHELHEENLSWAPYARFDFGRGKLDRVSETGVGIGALTYLEQKLHSSSASLGIRASAMHETEFGRVIPQLRLEYGRDLTHTGAAAISYADQPGGPSYMVAPLGESRSTRLIGVGAEFLSKGGLVFGFELGSNARFAKNPEYSTRFWLSSPIDSRTASAEGLATDVSKMPFTVGAAVRLDDNITRTGNPTPKLRDRIWSVSAGIDDKFSFARSFELNVGAQATAEKYATYDRLDSSIFAVNAELAYQSEGHFAAPRFAAFANAAYDDSRSVLRTGQRYEVGLNTRMLVSERAGISGVLSHSRRRARGEIYDTDFNSARVGADYQVSDRSNLRLGVEARRGDFVSSGRAMADSSAISEALADDDAFATQRFVAYRFPAKSAIVTLGYNLSISRRDAFNIAWTGIRVKPTKTPDYTWFQTYPTMGARGAGGGSSYSVQQFEVAYNMRF